MRRVLYISASARDVSDDDIAEILSASRRNNAACGVTGLLLHIDGGFLQILEGPGGAVDATMDRIGQDARHSQIIVLWRETISERGFPDWSMGFDRLTNDDPRWQGAFRLDPANPMDALAPDAAPEILALMRSFRDASTAKRYA